jgi:hypothetical protein
VGQQFRPRPGQFCDPGPNRRPWIVRGRQDLQEAAVDADNIGERPSAVGTESHRWNVPDARIRGSTTTSEQDVVGRRGSHNVTMTNGAEPDEQR